MHVIQRHSLLMHPPRTLARKEEESDKGVEDSPNERKELQLGGTSWK